MTRFMLVVYLFTFAGYSAAAAKPTQTSSLPPVSGFYGVDNPIYGELLFKNFNGPVKRIVPEAVNILEELLIEKRESEDSAEAADLLFTVAKQKLAMAVQKYDIEIYRAKSNEEAVFTLCFWFQRDSSPFCYGNFLLGIDEQQSMELIRSLHSSKMPMSLTEYSLQSSVFAEGVKSPCQENPYDPRCPSGYLMWVRNQLANLCQFGALCSMFGAFEYKSKQGLRCVRGRYKHIDGSSDDYYHDACFFPDRS